MFFVVRLHTPREGASTGPSAADSGRTVRRTGSESAAVLSQHGLAAMDAFENIGARSLEVGFVRTKCWFACGDFVRLSRICFEILLFIVVNSKQYGVCLCCIHFLSGGGIHVQVVFLFRAVVIKPLPSQVVEDIDAEPDGVAEEQDLEISALLVPREPCCKKKKKQDTDR